jgi:hypothetical protein
MLIPKVGKTILWASLRERTSMILASIPAGLGSTSARVKRSHGTEAPPEKKRITETSGQDERRAIRDLGEDQTRFLQPTIV